MEVTKEQMAQNLGKWCMEILERATLVVEVIKEEGFQNEQWALEFADALNKLSVEI